MPKYRDREKAFFGREMTHGGKEGLSIELISNGDNKWTSFIMHYSASKPNSRENRQVHKHFDRTVNHPRAIIKQSPLNLGFISTPQKLNWMHIFYAVG